MTTRRFAWTAAVLLAALVVACGRSSPPAPSSRGAAARTGDLTHEPGTVFNVTYTDRIVQVPVAEARAGITGITPDESEVTVTRAVAERLRTGSVLLVPNILVRRIDAIRMDGDRATLTTSDPAITDVIRDGRIEFDHTIDFNALAARIQARRPRAGLDVPAPITARGLLATLQAWLDPAVAAREQEGGGEQKIKGWDFGKKVSFATNRMTVDFTLHRKFGRTVVKIDGTAYVMNFGAKAIIIVENGELKHLDFTNRNLQAVVDLSWDASHQDTGTFTLEDLIELPFPFTIPLPVGGLPLKLEMKEGIYIKPALTPKTALSHGKFRLTISGDHGLIIKNNTTTALGNEGKPEIQEDDTTSLAGSAMLVAVNMPRLSLGFGIPNPLKLLHGGIEGDLIDMAADALIERFFKNDEGAKAFIQNFVQKTKKAFDNDASAYISFVLSASAVGSGPLAIVPCKQSNLSATGIVGASVKFVGTTIGDKSEKIFEKTLHRATPDVPACR